MEKVSIIGLDLAKRSLQAHGARADGGVAFRKKLSRDKVLAFLAEHPRCVVAMEAVGSQLGLRIWNFAARKPLNLRIYTLQNSHVGWLFHAAWVSILASSQRRSNAIRPLKIVSSRIASRVEGWAIARERPARSAGRKEMGRAATAA